MSENTVIGKPYKGIWPPDPVRAEIGRTVLYPEPQTTRILSAMIIYVTRPDDPDGLVVLSNRAWCLTSQISRA